MHSQHTGLEIRLVPTTAALEPLDDESIREASIAEVPLAIDANLANVAICAEKRVWEFTVNVYKLEGRRHHEQLVHPAAAQFLLKGE